PSLPLFFLFHPTPTFELYPLSLHDALPILLVPGGFSPDGLRGDKDDLPAKFAAHFLENDKPVFSICHGPQLLVDTGKLKGRTMTDRKSTRLNSSHVSISYAVFCLKKKNIKK